MTHSKKPWSRCRKADCFRSQINPDSAVAIGQEVRDTILPQRSRWVCASEPAIAQRCFNGSFKPHSDVVRERKITLKFHSRTPSLLQDSTSLPAFLIATAESGINSKYLVLALCVRVARPTNMIG